MSIDHGELNVPLSKRGRSIDAQIDDWKREELRKAKVERAERTKARHAARKAEKERVKFTAADLAGAVLVRDDCGWVRVVRVNAATVTVAGGLGEQRLPVASILDFKPRPTSSEAASPVSAAASPLGEEAG